MVSTRSLMPPGLCLFVLVIRTHAKSSPPRPFTITSSHAKPSINPAGRGRPTGCDASTDGFR